jgi:hypothetical protein
LGAGGAALTDSLALWALAAAGSDLAAGFGEGFAGALAAGALAAGLVLAAGFWAAGVDLAVAFFTMGFGAFFALAALTEALGAAALGVTLDLTGAADFALEAGCAGLAFEEDLAAALGAVLAAEAGFEGETFDLPPLAITFLTSALAGAFLAGAGLAAAFLTGAFFAGTGLTAAFFEGAFVAGDFLPVVLGFVGMIIDG